MDIASLVYDVSKDLCGYYVKAKERDNDLNGFRAQVLWVREKSGLIREVLQRPGVQSDNKSRAEDDLRKCKSAADELENAVAKLKTVDRQGKDLVARTKALATSVGLKTAWPLKKDTIAALASHLQTCRGALNGAISILDLNVNVSQVENLELLDKSITDGKTSLETALESIRKSTQNALQQVSLQLEHQKQMLTDERSYCSKLAIRPNREPRTPDRPSGL